MLTHEFKPMNAYVLLRIPKQPKKPITLTPEQDLELAQGLFFMVIAVSDEAEARVSPGDGVFFPEIV